MIEDVISQMGSMFSGAIPLVMCLVAVAAGGIMLFDARRLYRNRDTKASDCNVDLPADAPVIINGAQLHRTWKDCNKDWATKAPLMGFERAATDPKMGSASAYRQDHFFRK
jgi:hypothetical protein